VNHSVERVRQIYDASASHYDRLIQVPERLLFGSGREWASRLAAGRTLEVAAGTGRNLPHYDPEVALTAIDVSEQMLRIAEHRAARLGRDVEFDVADAHALPFADASFDTVVATLALCSIPDDRAAVAEMSRVLGPGGRLVLLEHVRSPLGAVRAAQRALEPLFLRFQADHLLREPERRVSEAGLEIEQLQRSKLGVVLRRAARNPPPNPQYQQQLGGVVDEVERLATVCALENASLRHRDEDRCARAVRGDCHRLGFSGDLPSLRPRLASVAADVNSARGGETCDLVVPLEEGEVGRAGHWAPGAPRIGAAAQSRLGRRDHGLLVVRADGELEEGELGTAVPVAPVVADHERLTRRVVRINRVMGRLDRVEVRLAAQRKGRPRLPGVRGLDQAQQGWVVFAEVWVARAEEPAGPKHFEPHRVLVPVRDPVHPSVLEAEQAEVSGDVQHSIARIDAQTVRVLEPWLGELSGGQGAGGLRRLIAGERDRRCADPDGDEGRHDAQTSPRVSRFVIAHVGTLQIDLPQVSTEPRSTVVGALSQGGDVSERTGVRRARRGVHDDCVLHGEVWSALLGNGL
jgi:ubiquinone/menaquinone biosynthesis C-methylase UbiE